jgi:hypothetical protein
MSDSYLLCRRCGVLQPVLNAPGTDDDALADLAAFRAAHAAHILEDAQRVPDSALYAGPAWDPMTTQWFRITTGTDTLVVRSRRGSIDEPRQHELAAALPRSVGHIDVDEALLRRAFARHFSPAGGRSSQLDRFVEVVQGLIADLDPDEVQTTYDDATVPNAGLGPFPAERCDALLRRCAPAFDATELERLRGFIADQRLEHNALALRVRRTVDASAL